MTCVSSNDFQIALWCLEMVMQTEAEADEKLQCDRKQKLDMMRTKALAAAPAAGVEVTRRSLCLFLLLSSVPFH